MDGLSSALIIILMFFLRLGVPLLITMLVGYVLIRLDRKWQAEADAERQADLKAERKAAIQPPAPPVGYQIPARQPAPLPAMVALATQPCWVVKGCSEAAKASCAAFRQPGLPCWVARTSAEGRLPSECADCKLHDPKLYQPTVPIWVDHGQDVVH